MARILSGGALCLSFLLTACGGDDGTPATVTPPATPPVTGGTCTTQHCAPAP